MNIQKAFSAIVLAVIFCSSNIFSHIDWINPMLIPMIQRRIVRVTPVMIPVARPIPLNPLVIGAIAKRYPQFNFNLRVRF